MGKRGPLPTPTAIKRARKSRSVTDSRHEPIPPRELAPPPCPQWLRGEARNCWRYITPRLVAMRVLTGADRNVVARYCVVWSEWRRVQRFIDRHGSSYEVMVGDVTIWREYPESMIVNRMLTQLSRLEQHLGLSPASRTRIATNDWTPQRPQDDAEDKRARHLKIIS